MYRLQPALQDYVWFIAAFGNWVNDLFNIMAGAPDPWANSGPG